MATEMKRSPVAVNRIEELLGDEARGLLDHKSHAIPKEQLYLPGPDYVDRVVAQSDRSPSVLRSIQTLLNHGRLAGTGYVSILPVDQGIEHSAGASFAPNPQYFDPRLAKRCLFETHVGRIVCRFACCAQLFQRCLDQG